MSGGLTLARWEPRPFEHHDVLVPVLNCKLLRITFLYYFTGFTIGCIIFPLGIAGHLGECYYIPYESSKKFCCMRMTISRNPGLDSTYPLLKAGERSCGLHLSHACFLQLSGKQIGFPGGAVCFLIHIEAGDGFINSPFLDLLLILRRMWTFIFICFCWSTNCAGCSQYYL